MDLKYLIILLTFLHSGLHAITASDDWSYSGEHGPEHWPGICVTGKMQSPINIATENIVKTDFGALKFIKYDSEFSWEVTNNGHSVQIKLVAAPTYQLVRIPIHLEGANLPSTYILDHIHFHWPAEHTMDGKRDVLELHFVHYNNQYKNASIASQHKNGVAVVATLFELNKENNSEIMPILERMRPLSNNTGANVTSITTKIIPRFFLPKDHTTYYHYDGSLTTPGCQETVMWYILDEKLLISDMQLNIVKNIGTINGTLGYNYRPIQTLGERKVYHHLTGYSIAITHSYNLLYVCFSLFLSTLLYLK
ncbi:PREDICTED: carbonic anhydrase 6 isoform X1 [Eufriesea mexicana]|uniref:carbonic anhydrase 6 isoform X1 n=1 Tax=Eufriesea mexicana TaxID=516756 RepID=UPI00083BC96E|nr:PREDICTED: carbonic anhydrase 6 isoform X1 [Eufriesea mexicana]